MVPHGQGLAPCDRAFESGYILGVRSGGTKRGLVPRAPPRPQEEQRVRLCVLRCVHHSLWSWTQEAWPGILGTFLWPPRALGELWSLLWSLGQGMASQTPNPGPQTQPPPHRSCLRMSFVRGHRTKPGFWEEDGQKAGMRSRGASGRHPSSSVSCQGLFANNPRPPQTDRQTRTHRCTY